MNEGTYDGAIKKDDSDGSIQKIAEFVESFANEASRRAFEIVETYENATIPRSETVPDLFHDVITADGQHLPKVCGQCGRVVYAMAGELEQIVVGLLGSERVAKTSCIAATLFGLDLDGAGIPGDITLKHPKSDTQWKNSVQIPLLNKYNVGLPVDKTNVGFAGIQMSATVTLELPKLTIDSSTRESVILTFVDMPGEYFNSYDGSTESRQWYVDHMGLFQQSDAFWYCVDLVQLIQTCNDQFMILAGYDTKEEGINRTAHIYSPTQVGSSLEAMKKEMFPNMPFPPTAVILTKSDLAQASYQWEDQVPLPIFKDGESFEGESEVYDTTAHNVLLSSFTQLSTKVRNILGAIRGGRAADMVFILDRAFPERAYFSTSAYSRVVKKENDQTNVQAPTPFKQRLPLYWTLAVLGKIPVYDIRDEVHKRFMRAPKIKTQTYRKLVRRNSSDSVSHQFYDELCSIGDDQYQ